MRVKMTKYGLSFWLWAALAAGGFAGIWHDPESDTIYVADFPQSYPCTPAQLAAADRMFGWNKVRRDPIAGVYMVGGNLFIGANDETDTYFQIGNAAALRETMSVAGNVFISPRWIKGENRENHWCQGRPRVNRLTVGDANNVSVNACLKIAGNLSCGNSKASQYWGGQLCVYNGKLSVDGEINVFGDRNVFDKAIISDYRHFRIVGELWWKKDINIVKNSVFRNAGIGLDNLRDEHLFENCIFTHCRTGMVVVSGATRLADCVFANNQIHWDLRGTNPVILLDCVVGEAAQSNKYSSHTGTGPCPSVRTMRHLRIKAAGDDGQPITDAEVVIRAEQPDDAEIPPRTFYTGVDGFAVGEGRRDAIPLLESIENAQGVFTASHTLTAGKNGRSGSVRNLRPAQYSDSTITITIKHEMP